APTAIPLATAAPTPAATATVARTPAPTPTSAVVESGHLFPSDVGRHLAPGRYAVGTAFKAPFSFDVPRGFALDGLREGMVAVSSPAGSVGAYTVDGVFTAPCRSAQRASVGSADDLVTALRAMKQFTAGSVAGSTLDGRSARIFDVFNAIDT